MKYGDTISLQLAMDKLFIEGKGFVSNEIVLKKFKNIPL